MKKIFKGLCIVLAVFVVIFIVIAIFANKDANAEKELANKLIQSEIAISGKVSEFKKITKEEQEERLFEKHIEVTGTVLEKKSLFIVVGDSDFSIKCYADNISSEISVDDEVTLNGVCTYVGDKFIRLRACKITDISKTEKSAEENTVNAEINSEIKNETFTDTQKESADKGEEATSEDFSQETNEKNDMRSEDTILEDIEQVLTDSLGDNTVKSVEKSRNDTIQIKVYFDRKSIMFSTDKLKDSVFDTAYITLKEYYAYIQSHDDAPANVSVIACFPNDGKDNADKDCYQVVCQQSDLEKFDFTSSDTSQMEEYSYICKWFISIQ